LYLFYRNIKIKTLVHCKKIFMKPCQAIPFLLIFSAFTACKEKEKAAAPVPEVQVVKVGQRDLPVYMEYVGQTFGQSDVEIQPRVNGWVQNIAFKEGSTVKKGQLLYVIQDDELKDREQSANAALAEADIMLVKAKSDLDRVKPLADMNALSKRDLDAAQATYDAQKEAVRSAQASLSNARLQLSYARILSPINGIIGISKVQVGDYVKNIGQPPINTVSTLGALRVRFPITEKDYLMYKQKLTEAQLRALDVEFILNDGSLYPEKGKLDFANREVDPTTGSLLIQAVVENKSNLLRPGQYVKVRFKAYDYPNAIMVPQEAINQMQNVYMAYLVNDSNRVTPRPVKVGERSGSNWVVTDGLKPGDNVALVGNAFIKAGMEIKPVMKPYSYDSTLKSQ
jgi:membrane fusion protein (multidrug efflux system)